MPFCRFLDDTIIYMAQIFVTRKIPDIGINMLKEAGHEVDVSEKDGVLTKEELLAALGAKPYDAVVSCYGNKSGRGKQ